MTRLPSSSTCTAAAGAESNIAGLACAPATRGGAPGAPHVSAAPDAGLAVQGATTRASGAAVPETTALCPARRPTCLGRGRCAQPAAITSSACCWGSVSTAVCSKMLACERATRQGALSSEALCCAQATTGRVQPPWLAELYRAWSPPPIAPRTTLYPREAWPVSTLGLGRARGPSVCAEAIAALPAA